MNATGRERPRIVVLDGYTLNPGDLSWEPLNEIGNCTIYDRTPADLILERSSDAEIVLTNKTILDRETIRKLPRMRLICILATGTNVVDLDAAREANVTVANVPDYSTDSVAEMTFALLLELARQTAHHAGLVREGKWSENPDFCFWDRPQLELAGRTMGIVGFGRIGRAVARLARAFRMEVLAATRHPERYRNFPEAREVLFTDVDTLFRRSDVVSLHCPLTPETEHLVDAERLDGMKDSAFLINTGRGPLIDEQALAEALRESKIAGAGLDVLSLEPPPIDNPLLQAPNCLITPHIAWATDSARVRLMEIAVANVRSFLEGHPTNVVS